jgi:prepilin-type N-terminal cleavage/methylation domain-containing protein
MTFRRGFTVLEALIVLAVFGLLATLAILSLNSARASLRDAQRLSDISVLRSSLSQYWLEKATYPTTAGVDLGSPGSNTDMLSAAGFVARTDPTQPIYLNRVPTGPRVDEYYRYRAGANGYSIRFQTETRTDLGEPNVYYAHATGIDREDAEK